MTTPSAPITILGRYFWKGYERFLVRGVVYQPDSFDFALGVTDPITDGGLAQLQHDIGLMKELGINTIGVYSIDNANSHTEAMRLLQEAGIYVFVTLSSSQHCINRNDPRDSYNASTLTSFFRTVDMMANFPNTLGVSVADNLINDKDSKSCVPFVAAVIRDLKRYMGLKNRTAGQRILPIGYGGTTSDERDLKVLEYLSTGDEMNCVDFWMCQGYLWTDKSKEDGGDFQHLIDKHRNTKIPIFLSEYSCVPQPPRTFSDTKALYSPAMTAIFSGGCIYEFWQNANGYGLAQMERNAAQTKRYALVPRVNPVKVAETRQTEWGTLLLLEDFMNYKTRLHETRGFLTGTDRSSIVYEAAVEGRSGTSFGKSTMEGTIPESCVDWVGLEGELKFS